MSTIYRKGGLAVSSHGVIMKIALFKLSVLAIGLILIPSLNSCGKKKNTVSAQHYAVCYDSTTIGEEIAEALE